MLPILKTIVEARGATILLDRSAVMYASTDTDITQQVIAELDKKLTSVTVEKTNLAELQKQAAEAQKKASAAAPAKKK
jgi:rRNA-processing protein FCF1